MFQGTWVCAVKCTIDCAPIHIDIQISGFIEFSHKKICVEKVSPETIKWSPSPATWARTTERGAISSEFPWQGKTDSSVGGGQAS